LVDGSREPEVVKQKRVGIIDHASFLSSLTSCMSNLLIVARSVDSKTAIFKDYDIAAHPVYEQYSCDCIVIGVIV